MNCKPISLKCNTNLTTLSFCRELLSNHGSIEITFPNYGNIYMTSDYIYLDMFDVLYSHTEWRGLDFSMLRRLSVMELKFWSDHGSFLNMLLS